MTFERILITGANGLLGQQLVHLLSQCPEYDVLATGRNEGPRYTDASCGYTALDITCSTQIRQVFEDFAPSIVVNCAAMTHVDGCERERDLCWKINVEGVRYLARQCKATGARLIQVSTDFIFDGEDGPYGEEDRPNPVNFYGKSKLAAENIVRQLGLQGWSIARTSMLYGYGNDLQHSNLGLWVVRKFMAGHPFPVFTDQWRNFTYVPDLASGIERLIRFKKTGVFHLSAQEFISVFEFVETVADVFGFDPELMKPTPSNTIKLDAARPPRTGFIILKATTELGYKPRTLRQALEHFRSHINFPVLSSTTS